ncbi:MAG: SDR family NAD(P)-dependent oxidoreductase [Candidatus Lokiarchaeota archaeon]|nr:SDR family NAD(P)-dependent oxidoreductase [Candidatus Lokiarchaeota archaeon]MBD3339875.1 SDR family NAD(P)-dependent oxidoreductase [Candidatus Lokiarchaeota archaeon]
MKNKWLEDKIALVIGASGGIGKETAILLEENGATLVISDINQSGLEIVRNELNNKPFIVPCDVTKLEEVKNLMKRVIEKYGRIDILINTVGIILPGAFEDQSYEDIQKQININLLGTIHVEKEVIPFMKKAEKGHIVTISSLAGIVPETYSSIYTATKFALRGLNFCLYFELQKYNIEVSTIFPDSVETPMLEYEAKHDGSPLTFLDEPVMPKEVAEAVLKAIKKKKVEVCVPHSTGVMSKLIMCMPRQVKRLWPKFEKKGEKKKKEYIKKLKERDAGKI